MRNSVIRQNMTSPMISVRRSRLNVRHSNRCQSSTHPDALPLVVLRPFGTATHPLPEPDEDVPDGLRRRDDIERRRNRSALLEVAHPQPRTGELPLGVGVALASRKRRRSNLSAGRNIASIQNEDELFFYSDVNYRAKAHRVKMNA